MKIITFLFSILSVFGSLFSQQQVYLSFTPKVQQTQFYLMDQVTDLNGKKMSVEYFNYYISDIHLFHDGNQDLDLSDTVLVVRADDFRINLGMLNITQLEKITFAVGVPEPKNHLDISLYPDKHPLSFQVPSMHWGWTDGYMFMIVGGLTDGDGDDVPETTFQLHSFGDANYYQVSVPVNLTPTISLEQEIMLYCNLDEWLGTNNLASLGIYHGSTDVNAAILKNAAIRPVFTSDLSAGIKTTAFTGNISAQSIEESLTVTWQEMIGLGRIELIDAQGKLVGSLETKNLDGSESWKELKKGMYLLRCYSQQDALLHQIKLVH